MLLNVLDRKWREHLYEMDYLKEGIGLRAMAQRDPLVEYQREGYDMFMGMLDGLKEESVGFLFNVQVEAAPQAPSVSPAGHPGRVARQGHRNRGRPPADLRRTVGGRQRRGSAPRRSRRASRQGQP